MGVVLAFLFLFLSTIFLTRSPKQTQGILIGYSAAGLPLYSSQQTGKTSSGNWFKPVIAQIIENHDSRRILFFLLLNLVSHCQTESNIQYNNDNNNNNNNNNSNDNNNNNNNGSGVMYPHKMLFSYNNNNIFIY